MSHPSQQEFVGLISSDLPEYFSGRKILEVGSLDINGTVRGFFSECEYIGIDIGPGKNVDVVCEGQKYDAPDNTFDQVISCEVMEHNPYWVETFQNMVRVCKPGGLIMMTCATTGRPEHGTSRSRPTNSPLTINQGWNYYKNLNDKDFEKALKLGDMFEHYQFWTNWSSYDLCFCGLKKSAGQAGVTLPRWNKLIGKVGEYIDNANHLKICRYRSFMAHTLGDGWFSIMHNIIAKLNYIHNG